MANFKVSILFAIFAFGALTYSPVNAQTKSTLDFWLTFAELLTEDILTKLGSVQVPTISVPTIPVPTIPAIPQVQFPQFPEFHWPVNSNAADKAPQFYFANHQSPTSSPPAPTPRPDGCQPEKVKIIVIEDCDEKKEESSESCEDDSDEVDIVVPYERKGRYSYRKSH